MVTFTIRNAIRATTAGPHGHQGHRLELDDELRPDARIADGALDPVRDAARATERGRIEDARHQRAEDTADGMHAEHVERVVRP